MRRFVLLSTISLLVFLPLLTFAQETEVIGTGNIIGTIVDTSRNRNPVGGATVSCVGPVFTYEVTSDPTTGEYEFTGLKPGQYVLAMHKVGYADRTEIPATVVAGNDTVVEIKMRKENTLITYFQKMGPMGLLLLFVFIVLLILLIYFLRAYPKNPQGS